MKKFQAWETGSGTEVGEPFEAKDKEEALSLLLEQQGYSVKEVSDDRPRISIIVSGGLIADVIIPNSVNVIVEVKDYDVEGVDEDRIEKDDDDNEFVKSEWSND